MNYLEHLLKNKRDFFNYMHEYYPLFKYSNVFLRDLQYAIISYFELKGYKIKTPEAEKLAFDFADKLCESNEFVRIDNKSWKIILDVGIKKESLTEEGVENE